MGYTGDERVKPRLGFFARRDNGGLGAESREFAQWVKPDKILAIRGEHNDFPERFRDYNTTYIDGIPTHAELDAFLRDIDVLFSIETFYNWGAVAMARSRGIKTVLRLNVEMNLNAVDPNCPVADWFIVPSPWHYDDIALTNKTYLPFPVNREVLPFKRKPSIDTFYFITGHPSYEDRGGRHILSAALPFIDAPVKVIDQAIHDADNYWEVHQGDCLIHPRRYGGQSLLLNEALSLGHPVIMPDISPQNAFLPPDWLVPTISRRSIMCQGGAVDCYDVDPRALAQKVNWLYSRDISQDNAWCDTYAERMSWPTLLPQYHKLFQGVVDGSIRPSDPQDGNRLPNP